MILPKSLKNDNNYVLEIIFDLFHRTIWNVSFIKYLVGQWRHYGVFIVTF